MRELSLHIMDLIENSLRAQATIILVSVEALPDQDLLRIVVEDNGTGLRVPVESVLDPFYTTKRGKRTGLGLSLFRAAAESTGGRLMIDKSALGDVGVRVTVEL
ncbi:MAG TPA: ATP-binding protein, partial [Phycisphaerae bacterium]|nr:ATP-binding protein [Phycisphaerae bacterium]